jgi:hypothetical protein
MAGVDIARLKKIAKLSADRASREDAELQTVSVRLDRTRNQKAIAKLLEKNIDGMASASRKFDALMARGAAEAEAQIEDLRTKALQIALRREPDLASMIDQRVKAFEALADGSGVSSVQRYLVNTPIEILATQLDLDSSAIVPSNSWAKFQIDMEKKQRNPSVMFRFVWENTTDKYVVLNANGYMILHGYCELSSDGGFFGGDRASTFSMTPTLELFDWTTKPYNHFVAPQAILAVDEHIDTGAWFDDAAIDPKYVFRGYDLLESLALVPPFTSVGIVMTCAMHVYTGQNSGRVFANFSSGSYQVGSPAVLISVLS